ncbi:MAG: DUF72 domain-containing protein [Vicinamibacterales bacterium]
MSNIRIGTSGWSYPSGKGTWKGLFYPKTRGDELSFYAEHFDTVEVNSSFYGPPTPASAKKWAERTPPGFEFALKLYQKFTHPEMFAKATGKDPFDLTQADIDEVRRGISPLAEAGKLGPLVAQFPASFRADAASREYLAWLLEAFRGYTLAVELRHKSWSDERRATDELLSAAGAALTQIDEPKFRDSIRQTFKPNVPGFFYMRLHGRNAASWWTHKAREDRYDYLYSEDELKPIADAVRDAGRAAKKAYVYMNNHFAAKAVANAAILKHQLGQELPGEYPPGLVERYPALAGIVRVSSPLLRTSS